MKKKNFWAYGVVSAFVIFATLMICFAVVASHHKIDLVVTDYYKAEIDYQHQMDKQKNYNTLPETPVIVYDNTAKDIRISWPAMFIGKEFKGDLYLYRPDKPDRDIHVAIKNANEALNVPASNLMRGKYILKLSFTVNEVGYYTQEEIFIK